MITIEEVIKKSKETVEHYSRPDNIFGTDTKNEIVEWYSSIVFWLSHYWEIRKIIGQWNSDYYAEKSKSEYFDMILETFKGEDMK